MKHLLLIALLLAASSVLQAAAPNLVPWPKTIEVLPGELNLSPKSRIVAGEVQLQPLAEVLSEESFLLTGLKLTIAKDGPAAGDVVLQIDKALKGEAYTLKTDKSAVVRGGNYGAVALGTVTLLQSLSSVGEKFSLPHISVEDTPATEYRGLIVDVARCMVAKDEVTAPRPISSTQSTNTMARSIPN